MIKNRTILPVVFVMTFVFSPQAFAQGQAPARAGAGVDQEPALTVQLRAELVEISPTGMRSLGRVFGTTMHAGEEGGGNLAIDQAGMVRIRTRLAQIGNDSLILDLSISESDTGRVLASRSLS